MENNKKSSIQKNKTDTLQNNNTNIKKQVIEKIKKENLKPQSKVYLKAKNTFFWILLLLSITIGILATGMLFYFQKTLEEYFFTNLKFQNKLQFLRISFPIFWIASLILSFYGIIKAYRSTKYGYKIPSITLIILISVLLLIIGTRTIITNMAATFDRKLNLPQYMQIRSRHEQYWMCPQHGRITGKILNIDKDSNIITIILPNREKWKIDISNIKYFSEKFNYCNKTQQFLKQKKTKQSCNATKKQKDDTYNDSSTILDILAEILLDHETVFIRAEGQAVDVLQFKAEKLFPAFYHQPYKQSEDSKNIFNNNSHTRNKDPPCH